MKNFQESKKLKNFQTFDLKKLKKWIILKTSKNWKILKNLQKSKKLKNFQTFHLKNLKNEKFCKNFKKLKNFEKFSRK